MTTVRKLSLDDPVQTPRRPPSPVPARVPVPESVRGWGGFHVKLGHRHAPGGHLGGEHGRRIHDRGRSHLQSKQRDRRVSEVRGGHTGLQTASLTYARAGVGKGTNGVFKGQMGRREASVGPTTGIQEEVL